jgi:NADPH-dependent curcumin reductase CurA
VAERNRRLVLAARPSGMVDESTVRVEEEGVPEPGEGEALARVRYLSIDPTIRTWMDDAPGYLPPIQVDDVIRGAGIAEVLHSNTDRYAPGDLLFGMTGWQDYVIADEGERAMQSLPAGVAPTIALGLFGITGMTAYFGMTDVGRVKEGDVVVISGAAGATGSTAGQIAKLKGAAKVVGIAGGPQKCGWIAEELGFDATIDYKGEDVSARLRELVPEGIDLFFDNVGGEILDACLANYRNLIVQRGRMEGFIILDYVERFPEAQAEIAGWLGSGQIKAAEHLVEGLERAPEALNLLFTGGNTGKVIVQV